jgi:hypothetical protein
VSKGSKQRPTDTAKYSDNWDRIFKKPSLDEAKFWRHECKKDKNCVYFVEVGHACNWCGKFEDGTND